jgi:hypothetical protein
MATNKNNPGAGQRVRNVEGLKVHKTYKPNVTTTSQTLATLMGEAIQADCGLIEVFNNSGTSVHFQNGTATTSHAELPTGRSYPFYGRDTDLAAIEFVAGSTLAVSIIQHVSI